ncbi:MAG: TolC family protein [Planctomycetaceae bacterium]|nr:TolC family protein [Planctomycetaceae bacterium]
MFSIRSCIALSGVLGLSLAVTTILSAEEPAVVPPSPEAESGLTLDVLTSIAESTSPNLTQSAAEVQAARGRAHQAGLYPNPVGSGGAMQLGGRDSQYFVQLSQEIVTKHKLQLSEAAACREVFQAEYRFVRTRFDLLTAVRQGYYAVLAGQKRVDILRQLVGIAAKSQTAATRLKEAGEGTRSDALLFQIEVEKAEVALQNAEAVLAAALRQLTASLGAPEMELDRVEGDLRISLVPFAEQVVVDGYIPYNAEISVAEQEVDRNRLLLKRAQVEPFPNITVNAGYMRQYTAIENIGIINLSAPLPLWNKNQGNISAAVANVTKASANVATIRNTIAKQMADARGRYRAADQLVVRYEEKIIPLARESVKVIQEAFDQGQFDFLRLLQAQRALVESQLGYISALETRWMTAAELSGLAQVEAFP